MESRKTPLSINVIYWFTNIALGLIALTFLFWIIFNIILYSVDGQGDIGFSLRLPVKFDLKETGSLQLSEQDVKLKLLDASSRVQLVNPPRYVTKLTAAFTLLVILFASYPIFVFREFIKNVKEGNVFSVVNILLLKRIAYLLAVVWFIQDVVMKFVYFYFMNRMEFKNISLIKSFSLSVDFFNYQSILFIAIFIWVLAHIFMTGLKLQEEKDLTI